MSEIEIPSVVYDEYGGRYRLKEEPLGRGGQGVVFETEHHELLVKLLLDQEGRPVLWDGAQRLRHRLEIVRTMELPDQVAAPIALLSEYAGYVMRMLRDMQPVSKIIQPSGDEDPADFFRRTGGLGRRIRILHNLAVTLAGLHAMSMIYSDLSPNNVFVSTDPEHDTVWLIDADNLHYSTSRQSYVFTPDFAAPELLNGSRPATTLSDAWSFAVLAHLLLTMNHPFDGVGAESDDVTRWSEEDEWGDEGQRAWVFHPSDRSNPLPVDFFPGNVHRVFSPRLFRLFLQTFDAGRYDLMQRPGMGDWVHALRSAMLAVVDGECGHSYFGFKAEKCPWCGRKLPNLLYFEARTRVEDEDGIHLSETPVFRGVKTASGRIDIPDFVCRPVAVESLSDSGVELDFRVRGVLVTAKEPLNLVTRKGQRQITRNGTMITRDELDRGVSIDCPWSTGGGRVVRIRRRRP